MRLSRGIAALLTLSVGCAAGPQPIPFDPLPETQGSAETCADLRQVVPLHPNYPRRAYEVGQEGWVIVHFDVGPEGMATNVRIPAASPSGVFESMTLGAMKRAKFAPPGHTGCEIVLQYRMR